MDLNIYLHAVHISIETLRQEIPSCLVKQIARELRNSMSSTDNNNKVDIDKLSTDICANCGKGEENNDSLKACTACHMVKYCNRECQIAHRPQHKKECKKRAAELHDKKLFKQPPPEYGDCPICFLPMPSIHTGRIYMTCCGLQIPDQTKTLEG